ncbi:alpha/beta hydrolase family protein [Nocardia nova SH22a]|uniref:Alpha/beta hydrolase family protein n=1 Tax=Nocardia nova SH22a TaxID=1415166 RepID=W5T7K7_9NOCA|nr:alpha/beta hydrolase [Nocardia nova]AHH15310.1 alpha/beta hydrolase family protein [Nocardia nova SH22a]
MSVAVEGVAGELIAVGRDRIHLCRGGDPGARAVVLIHGFGGSLHWFERVASPLVAAGYQPIRIDLRGHGYTRPVDGRTTVADLGGPAQGRMVADLLDVLDLEDVVVVGHSFGADVALATAHSARVGAVGIIDQAPDYSYAKFPSGNAALANPVLGPVLHRLATPPFVRIGLRYAVAPGFDLCTAFADPDQAVIDYRMMNPAVAQAVVTERRRRLAADPLDAQLARLALPAHVVHGTADRFYDWKPTAQRYRAAGARVDIIEGAGHSPNVERPEQVAELLGEFLRSTAAS